VRNAASDLPHPVSNCRLTRRDSWVIYNSFAQIARYSMASRPPVFSGVGMKDVSCRRVRERPARCGMARGHGQLLGIPPSFSPRPQSLRNLEGASRPSERPRAGATSPDVEGTICTHPPRRARHVLLAHQGRCAAIAAGGAGLRSNGGEARSASPEPAAAPGSR
jgi:hypothetical protein